MGAIFYANTRGTREEKKHLLVYENCIAIGVRNVENHYAVCHDGPRRDKETLDASVNKIVLVCI